MKNRNHNQQGDVLLKRVKSLPSGCKAIKDKRGVVLAEGEATGHYHGTNETGVALFEAPNGIRYMHNQTDSPIKISHQEHTPITVDPGIWQIGQVREKDWFRYMVGPVRD